MSDKVLVVVCAFIMAVPYVVLTTGIKTFKQRSHRVVASVVVGIVAFVVHYVMYSWLVNNRASAAITTVGVLMVAVDYVAVGIYIYLRSRKGVHA